METVEFNGWKHCVRLFNDEMELIVTRDVGPRVVRCAFIGEANVFAEIDGQQGGSGEAEWMIRGGHRFWIAPEEKPKTYELDNSPIEIEEIENGIRTVQPVGPLSGVAKTMEITLAPDGNRARVLHKLENRGEQPVALAPWALSVMAVGGMAIIPLPEKIAHTDRLTHNQEWSLWGYTDFTDPRWTLGSRYIFFRQDTTRGPNKLGIAHREGWVAYQLDSTVFTKRFRHIEGARYPDGGCNFETFSNEEFLEIESLGPMVTLAPGETTNHEEEWRMARGIPSCDTEADADAHVRPLAD
jgi:hypothetical protein